MIFLTVGSQMPFDRLVQAVDEALVGQSVDAFAQIGDSAYRPTNMRACRALAPADFAQQVRSADLVIGHAGMGTVLTALEYAKPLLMLPRRGDLLETRNDHQLATLKWLRDKPGLYAAEDELALKQCIERYLRDGGLPGPAKADACPALDQLCHALHRFAQA